MDELKVQILEIEEPTSFPLNRMDSLRPLSVDKPLTLLIEDLKHIFQIFDMS